MNPAIVSEIEGFVKFGAEKKDQEKLLLNALDGSDEKIYNVSYGNIFLFKKVMKFLLVKK